MNVTACWKKERCDRDHERCVPILVFKIKVLVSFNQLLSDLRMTKESRHVDRCGPIVLLKINVTKSFNQLLRDDSQPL